MTEHLFPLLDYWWFYAAFTGLVVVFLVLDLGLFHRKPHVIGFREALAWTAVWATLALLFCLCLYKYAVWKFAATTGQQIGVEFLTGYVVEWSLSLDNMFVFVLVFRYFGIPALLQHRVLFFGILGALIFRGVFIALGAALLQYGWVVILFGIFLILTGIQMMFSAERQVQPEQSRIENYTPRPFCWRSRSSRQPIFFSPSTPFPPSLPSPASHCWSTRQTCLPF
jgi:tellurite resistance protein TerC